MAKLGIGEWGEWNGREPSHSWPGLPWQLALFDLFSSDAYTRSHNLLTTVTIFGDLGCAIDFVLEGGEGDDIYWVYDAKPCSFCFVEVGWGFGCPPW